MYFILWVTAQIFKKVSVTIRLYIVGHEKVARLRFAIVFGYCINFCIYATLRATFSWPILYKIKFSVYLTRCFTVSTTTDPYFRRNVMNTDHRLSLTNWPKPTRTQTCVTNRYLHITGIIKTSSPSFESLNQSLNFSFVYTIITIRKPKVSLASVSHDNKNQNTMLFFDAVCMLMGHVEPATFCTNNSQKTT
jgi:hypothetical protein